ncbi:acyltransferase [Endozoicomonas acroporae]|uniref:acyltransferase n=1 Tax=Endozoicomonas acroporae TaxID=1701104 RepID=UPI000C78668E|nr:acyltransferase [Endozoicomonas acroporae]
MLNSLKARIKNSDSVAGRALFSFLKSIRSIEMPVIRPAHGLMYQLHKMITGAFSSLIRIFYWTPLFKSQLANAPGKLYLYSGMPLLLGPLTITMGDHCRLSGHTTISGRASGNKKPELRIGNNVGISWQNEIFVGDQIEIGDNVRLAVKVRLVGYPGHPVDPAARAQGKPDTDDQVGSIIIQDDVWLAAGVTVMGGVTIGAGTIVATGSVVTRDLPPGVLAGGIPARVIKSLNLPSERDNG